MNLKNPVAVFWFRRDLRLDDNAGLFHALKGPFPVLPLFIFDTNILNSLCKDDPRVSFIYDQLKKVNRKLKNNGSRLIIKHGEPLSIWQNLIRDFNISEVYANHDYEPYSINRDLQIRNFLRSQNIKFITLKDQVIFEKDEVMKQDGKPYTLFTPYLNKWMARLHECPIQNFKTENYFNNFLQIPWTKIPELSDLNFVKSKIQVCEMNLDRERLLKYEQTRNFPALDGTSMAGPHLRFGTISIRELVNRADSFENKTYLKELVWREFFMQILYHFPGVVEKSFKPAYNKVAWINNEDQYQLWCEGKTGYPLVDAGMQELNTAGFMHNRVRMVVASFLCKHLLIDWRWSEAYFAEKLLDYELSSNNGNWQWAAGSGCDAAPYFRIFNPAEQMKKFDPDLTYVMKWIPEWGTKSYPKEIVDHKFARLRAISQYKKSLTP